MDNWKISNLLGVSSDSRTQKSWKVGSRTEICQGIHFWHLFPILKSILAPSSAFVATQSEISKIDQIWKCYIDHESEMQLKTNGVFGTYPNTRYCVTFFDFEKHQKWIPWRIPLLDPTFQDLFPPKSEVGRGKHFAKSHINVFFSSPELQEELWANNLGIEGTN